MATTPGRDVFGFLAKSGPGFIESEEAVLITAGTGAGTGTPVYLIQDWNVTYNINIQPIYECGTSTVYWSAKHASGQVTINRIIADSSDLKTTFGWICGPGSYVIKAYTGRCSENATIDNAGSNASSTPVELTIGGSILSGVTYSGNSQQAYVSENLQAMFASLTVKNGSSKGATPGTWAGPDSASAATAATA